MDGLWPRAAEELVGAHRVHVPPEPAELLLDRPGAGRLQATLSDGHESAALRGREIGLVEEPKLPRSLESVIVLGLESLVLGSSHLIDCFSQVLGDMELVVDELGIRGLVGHRIRVGRQHVGSHRPDLLPLLDGEGLQDRLRCGLGSLRSHVEDARAVEIGEDGDVVLAFSEVLLVDAKVGNGLRLASLETRLHSPIHDRLGRVPREAKERGGGLDGAARLQDFDGKGFKEQGEPAVLPGPRRHDRLHSVIRAPAPGQPGDQLRRELHRVEVPPATLFRVVGQPAGNAALWAGNACADVIKADFDSPLVEPKFNSIDSPGVVEAQQLGVVRGKCVHPGNLRRQRSQNDRPVPRSSPKNLKRRGKQSSRSCSRTERRPSSAIAFII